MNENEINDLEKQVKELFGKTLPPESDDKLTDSLMHTALYNTYLTAIYSNMQGVFTPHRFLPSELVPLLDGVSINSFSTEELSSNFIKRVVARKELVKMAKKDPTKFVDVINRLFQKEVNSLYDPNTGVLNQNLTREEQLHSEVTARLAYLIMPDLWRDISLNLTGRGNYLIGFQSNGQAVSKRTKEAPDNPAAFKETVIKWANIAGHAVSFFSLNSLDRLVNDGDIWSDIGVIEGYPYIAKADEHADRLIRYGYDARERYSPILHEFPLNKDSIKKQKYKEGQSIASITIVDLDSPCKGIEYAIRHSDGTIAVGKLFLSKERDRFTITASNHVQYMVEKVGPVILDPLLGVGLLVAAMGRDMMVYNKVERTYQTKRGMQHPSLHKNPEPVEIWLPRSKYEYNIEPRLAASEYERLGELVREVSPHPVSRHKRILLPGQEASEKQLQLAASLPRPYPVPPGCTFVRDHWVGTPDETMTQHYKSRSAAAYLFSAR